MDFDEFENAFPIRSFSSAGDQLHDNPKVWRYLDLMSLLWILETEHLHFSPLSRLKEFDPLEGTGGLAVTVRGRPHPITISGMELPEEKERVRVIEEQLDVPLEEQKEGIKEKVRELEELNRNVFASCWHTNEMESDFMWRIYAKDIYGFAIVSTVEYLVNSIISCGFPSPKLGYGFVMYLSRAEHLENEIESTLHPHYGYMLKSPEFKHEQEFRLFVRPKKAFKEVCLPVDLHKMVTEIRVSPLMPKWARGPAVAAVDRILREKKLTPVTARENILD